MKRLFIRPEGNFGRFRSTAAMRILSVGGELKAEIPYFPSRLLDLWPTVAGQVLDMQPMATAVYEKLSDQTAQPEPQK